MAKQVKKGGGGRLNRSETVTVRLDPKLNYLAEIAARAQRRTKSNLIEAALAQALNIVPIDSRTSEEPHPTIAQLAEDLWHIDDVERLKRLVKIAPHLLTYEEQKIWAVICDNRYFWLGMWRPLNDEEEYYSIDHDPNMLWEERVRDHWSVIRSVADGTADKSVIPEGPMKRRKPGKPINQLSELSVIATNTSKEAK